MTITSEQVLPGLSGVGGPAGVGGGPSGLGGGPTGLEDGPAYTYEYVYEYEESLNIFKILICSLATLY